MVSSILDLWCVIGAVCGAYFYAPTVAHVSLTLRLIVASI